jgi:LPXTG-motif cell wall-anchored protein
LSHDGWGLIPINSSAAEFGSYLVKDTSTPLLAALPLFVTGLGGLSLLGWRRKRKNATAIATA